VNPDATGAGYVAPDPTHSAATTAHGKVGAGFDSSIGQSAKVENPSDERGVGYDTPAPTHSEPMLTRLGMGADGILSIDQADHAPAR
jgi:hypothetical protein